MGMECEGDFTGLGFDFLCSCVLYILLTPLSSERREFRSILSMKTSNGPGGGLQWGLGSQRDSPDLDRPDYLRACLLSHWLGILAEVHVPAPHPRVTCGAFSG